ncbi:MAG: SGNH/GDSL hydrolase family protein [Acutalibacteraceae bacterium]
MKKILLLGDSIRENYQERVKELLKGDGCEVFHPDENCRFSRYTLNSLRHWLPKCTNPDVIHWNNGLWDVMTVYPEDGCFTELSDYIRDMGRILRELKKTGAKVIFATTTAVGDGNPNRLNETIELYNTTLINALGKKLDEVNDLYSLTRPRNNVYIRLDDKVHLTDEGIEVCSKAVADKIRDMLK